MNTGSGINCTCSKYTDDTKLSAVATTLESRDVIQRDLDGLERWTHMNLMKINNTNCKVLHMGGDHLQYQYRIRIEWTENSPEEKDLGILVDEKLNVTQKCVLAAQNANLPWAV